MYSRKAPGLITGFAADKSLGQHWLIDQSVINTAIDALKLGPSERVVEIGPGQGILTEALLATGAEVMAVEYDEALAKSLTTLAMHLDNFSIIHQDFLQFDLEAYASIGEYKLVGNIPYNITNKIVAKLVEIDSPPMHAVLLIQQEVANNLTSDKPATISRLAFDLYGGSCSILLARISPDSFDPPPKVNSALVELRFQKPKAGFNRTQIEATLALAKVAFNSKRKKLTNTLSTLPHLSQNQVIQALEELKLSSGSRPQELTAKNWAELYRILTKEAPRTNH